MSENMKISIEGIPDELLGFDAENFEASEFNIRALLGAERKEQSPDQEVSVGYL